MTDRVNETNERKCVLAPLPETPTGLDWCVGWCSTHQSPMKIAPVRLCERSVPPLSAPPREGEQAALIGLRPCPFCGPQPVATPVLVSDPPSPALPLYWIECSRCNARGPDRSSGINAIEYWNSRIPPESAPIATEPTWVCSACWIVRADYESRGQHLPGCPDWRSERHSSHAQPTAPERPIHLNDEKASKLWLHPVRACAKTEEEQDVLGGPITDDLVFVTCADCLNRPTAPCPIPLDGPSAMHSEMADNGDLDAHIAERHVQSAAPEPDYPRQAGGLSPEADITFTRSAPELSASRALKLATYLEAVNGSPGDREAATYLRAYASQCADLDERLATPDRTIESLRRCPKCDLPYGEHGDGGRAEPGETDYICPLSREELLRERDANERTIVDQSATIERLKVNIKCVDCGISRQVFARNIILGHEIANLGKIIHRQRERVRNTHAGAKAHIDENARLKGQNNVQRVSIQETEQENAQLRATVEELMRERNEAWAKLELAARDLHAGEARNAEEVIARDKLYVLWVKEQSANYKLTTALQFVKERIRLWRDSAPMVVLACATQFCYELDSTVNAALDGSKS